MAAGLERPLKLVETRLHPLLQTGIVEFPLHHVEINLPSHHSQSARAFDVAYTSVADVKWQPGS